MSKREQNISDALGNIDADYIEQALDYQLSKATVKRKRRVVWSAVACACLAVIVAVSVGWLWRGDEPGVEPPDDNPPVVEPPEIDSLLGNGMNFSSWEELKFLYDAAQLGDDEFLDKSWRLERYCEGFGLYFDSYPSSMTTKDAFWDMYGEMADRQILVPVDSELIQLDGIFYDALYSRRGPVSCLMCYQFQYGQDTFFLRIDCDDKFENEMEREEGEPIAIIKGNGYSVKTWLSYYEYYYGGYCKKSQYPFYAGYITIDGADSPALKVVLRFSNYSCPDVIPQELLSLFEQFRITTPKEMVENADTLDLPELPKFNVISEYQSAGKRLVDSVFVSKEEFLSVYPHADDYSYLLYIFWPRTDYRSEYEVRYRFDYALDPDTNEVDRSKLVSGVSTHLRDGEVGQVFCISENGPLIDYVFDCDSAVIANFDGVDVELYDLSKDGQPLYCAVFQIGPCYVTYETRGGDQYDMICCVDWIIQNCRDWDLIPD